MKGLKILIPPMYRNVIRHILQMNARSHVGKCWHLGLQVVLGSLQGTCKTNAFYLESLQLFVRRTDACAAGLCSAEKKFARSWRFVHEFGKLLFDAKLFDGGIEVKYAFLDIIQQKMKTPSSSMRREEIQMPQARQKQVLGWGRWFPFFPMAWGGERDGVYERKLWKTIFRALRELEIFFFSEGFVGDSLSTFMLKIKKQWKYEQKAERTTR